MPRRARWILGAALFVHALLLVSQHTGWLTPLFNDARNRPGPGADFYAVYHAGRQVLTGRHPYAHDESPRVTPPYYAPFRYPPGVAFTLGAGVAWIKPRVAYVGWLVVLELLLAACVWRAGRCIEEPERRAWVQAGFLAFPPWFLELWMGQFTFAAAALMLLATLAWHAPAPAALGRRHAALAATGWALASALKLFPLALAPALLRQRRWAALGGAAVAMALAFSWFIGAPDDLRGFMGLNFGAPELTEVHAGNFGLHAFLYRVMAAIGGPPEAASYAAVSRATSLLLAGVAAVTMLRARGADLRLSAAMALWLLPLASKDSWEHHYVVAPCAVALMVSALGAQRGWLRATAAVWAVIALPSALVLLQDVPSAWYPDTAWSTAETIAYHAPRPLAALSGFSMCVVAAWRRSPPA